MKYLKPFASLRFRSAFLVEFLQIAERNEFITVYPEVDQGRAGQGIFASQFLSVYVEELITSSKILAPDQVFD